MARQHERNARHQKAGRKSSNFIEIFVSKRPLSDKLKVRCMKAASSPASQSKSCQNLHAGFVRAFADKPGPWLPKAWTSVCNALQKQMVFSHGRFRFFATESSPNHVCSHQNRLEDIPSLGRKILLYLSEKSLSGDHVLLPARRFCECNMAKNVDKFRTIGEGFASIFVGIFFQSHAKEVSHLARRMMDCDWSQRGLHHAAFARLQGEPAVILTHSSWSEMDFNEKQCDEESMPSLLTALEKLSYKIVGQQMINGESCHHQQQNCPDKEALSSVQDFFDYTEFEGKKVFEELDRDADGKLTLDDLEVAMRKMKLPVGYAKDFMQTKHWLWPAKDYGWPEFSSLLLEKEPVIVELFNSLGVSKSGTVKRLHVKDALVKAGLSASEDNIAAMMRLLAGDASDDLKYGNFRRFMLLLPAEQLAQDPWNVWLKAATAHGIEHVREDLKLHLLDHFSLAN